AAKSIRATYGRPLGISIDRLLTFEMEFNDALYPEEPAAGAPPEATREGLATGPGIVRATTVTAIPILGDSGMLAITVDDRPTVQGEPTPMAVVTGVRGDAMAALGIGLR